MAAALLNQPRNIPFGYHRGSEEARIHTTANKDVRSHVLPKTASCTRTTSGNAVHTELNSESYDIAKGLLQPVVTEGWTNLSQSQPSLETRPDYFRSPENVDPNGDCFQSTDPEQDPVEDREGDADDGGNDDDDDDDEIVGTILTPALDLIGNKLENTQTRPTAGERELSSFQKRSNQEIVNLYSEFARAWLDQNEYGYRGHQNDARLSAEMHAYLSGELRTMLKPHAGNVARSWRLDFWALASGAAGFVPMGKTIVGAGAKYRTKRIISDRFGVDRIKVTRQEERNQSREVQSKKKDDKVKKATKFAYKIAKSQAAAEIADNVFFETFEEIIHCVPIVGQIYSASKGYSRTRKHCKQAVQDALETAAQEHGKTRVKEVITLVNDDHSRTSMPTAINIYKMPSCAACFLGGMDGKPQDTCCFCLTYQQASPNNLSANFRRCKKGHDKKIPKEKELAIVKGWTKKIMKDKAFAPEHAHHKHWCTKALLAKSRKPKAWECIPCFLKYGKHKPRKCVLRYKDNCSHCGVKGHHQGACGMRFFHAVRFIDQLSRDTIDMRQYVQNRVLSVQNKRTTWTRVGLPKKPKKQLWSQINGHVVSVGENWGHKAMSEQELPVGSDLRAARNLVA